MTKGLKTRSSIQYSIYTYVYTHISNITLNYGSRGCGACKQMKPKLKNVSDLLPMVYVEAQMFSRATQLYPGVIKEYPTFALFENGYFKATVNFKTIWFDIEKIIKNEYI